MIGTATIADAEAYVRSFFAADASGHDALHSLRVCRSAIAIAQAEGAREDLVALAALLHDVDDHKLSPATADTLDHARSFMEAHDVSDPDAQAVLQAIREVSFSQNGNVPPSSIEAACVRDADRLDALGAIGIARAFAYGGAHGRALHDPSGANRTTTIQHFYDKLLLLKDLMCTSAGRALACKRDAFTRSFLDEFLKEW